MPKYTFTMQMDVRASDVPAAVAALAEFLSTAPGRIDTRVQAWFTIAGEFEKVLLPPDARTLTGERFEALPPATNIRLDVVDPHHRYPWTREQRRRKDLSEVTMDAMEKTLWRGLPPEKSPPPKQYVAQVVKKPITRDFDLPRRKRVNIGSPQGLQVIQTAAGKVPVYTPEYATTVVIYGEKVNYDDDAEVDINEAPAVRWLEWYEPFRKRWLETRTGRDPEPDPDESGPGQRLVPSLASTGNNGTHRAAAGENPSESFAEAPRKTTGKRGKRKRVPG